MSINHEQARQIFNQAKQLSNDSRDAFLQDACGDDSELLGEVLELLKFHSESAETIQNVESEIDYSKGAMIGPFKVLRKLGEGGCGVVYLAEQQKPVKRRVALKVIKPGTDTKRAIARFEAERQALAIMNHPGIAQVYEAGVTDRGLPYFAMEEVKGIPITAACDEQKFSVEQRLELMVDVCDAVQHAHMRAIIHRDIKPSNILVYISENGSLSSKIIDFGIAKAIGHQLTDKTLATFDGHMLGTPTYMSPEQANPTATDIDVRSDVYSLGIVLYELLVGKPPFDSETLGEAGYDEKRRIICEEEPPRPTTKLSSMRVEEIALILKNRQTEIEQLSGVLQKELEWIPLMAMRKLRHERYDSAKALGDDIKRYLAKEALVAGPRSASYHLKKYIGRHKGILIAASLVFCTLVAGIIVSTIYAIDASRQKSVAIEQASIAKDAEATAIEQALIAEKAEGIAVEQMNQVQEVRDYLAVLLGVDFVSIESKNQTGEESRAIKLLLTKAAVDIPNRFSNMPVVAQELYRLIGSGFQASGFWDEAEVQFENALRCDVENTNLFELDLRKDLCYCTLKSGNAEKALTCYQNLYSLANDSLGSLDSRTLDAKVFVEMIKYRNSQGQAPYNQQINSTGGEEVLNTLDLCRRELGDEHPTTRYAMLQMVQVFSGDRSSLEKADALFEELLKIESPSRVGEEWKYYMVLGSLSRHRLMQKQYEQSEEAAEECIRGFQQHLGISHSRTLSAMKSLIRIRQTRLAVEGLEDNSAETILPLYKQIADLTMLQFDESKKTLEAYSDYITAAQDEFQYGDSEVAIEELFSYANSAVDLASQFYGEGSVFVFKQQSIYANLLDTAGEADRARVILQEVLEKSTETLGEKSHTATSAMWYLGNLEWVQGRYEIAEKYLKRVVEIYEDDSSYTPVTLSHPKMNLARLLSLQGKYDDAIELFLSISTDFTNTWSEKSWESYPGKTEILTELAEVYGEAGYYEKAISVYSDIIESYSGDKINREMIALHVDLGWILRNQGKSNEAEELISGVLDESIEAYGLLDKSVLQLMWCGGVVKSALNKYDEAEAYFQKVLDGYRRLDDYDDPMTLKAHLAYGELLTERGDYQEAKKVLDEGHTIAKLSQGGESFTAYEFVISIAELESARCNFELAKEMFQKAFEFKKNIYPRTGREVVNAGQKLASCLVQQGELFEAERILINSLENPESEDEPKSKFATLALLSRIYCSQARYRAAEKLMLEWLPMFQTTQEEPDWHSIAMLRSIGDIYSSQGLHAEAEGWYRQASDGSLVHFKDSKSSIKHSFIAGLASCLISQGKIQEAELLLLKSLEESSYFRINSMMGELYVAKGNYEEATSWFVRAIEVAQANNESIGTILGVKSLLISCILKQGETSDAQRIAEQALQESKDTYYDDSNYYYLVLTRKLADVYADQQKYDSAEKLYRKVLATNTRLYGDDAFGTMQTSNELGSLLRRSGRLNDSEELLSTSFQLTSRVFGSEHPLTMELLGSLGELYIDQKEYEKAESNLVRHYQYLSRVHGESHEKSNEAVSMLLRLYEANGDEIELKRYTGMLE